MPAYRLTDAQALLREHLSELGIATVPEFRFCLERKFRFDLYSEFYRIGFEVNGTYQGLHGPRFGGSDNEKIRLAQVLGYRILPFSNKEVLNGSARAWIAQYLLGLPNPSYNRASPASQLKARARGKVPYRAAK